MRCVLAFLFLAASVALAGEPFWRDEHGNFVPNTESRSAIEGFAGWLVITSDADWKQKWETSPDTVPRFNAVSTIGRGKHIFILTFFASAKPGSGGETDVTCDIDVVRPDGSSSVHQADAVCFRGQIKGSPTNLYLSQPILDFFGDPGDPAGKWLVRVTLKDNVRHVSLPLKTSFTLVDDSV